MKINSIKPPSPSPTGYVYIPVDKKQVKSLNISDKIMVHLKGTVTRLSLQESGAELTLEMHTIVILPDDEENEYTKMARDDE